MLKYFFIVQFKTIIEPSHERIHPPLGNCCCPFLFQFTALSIAVHNMTKIALLLVFLFPVTLCCMTDMVKDLMTPGEQKLGNRRGTVYTIIRSSMSCSESSGWFGGALGAYHSILLVKSSSGLDKTYAWMGNRLQLGGNSVDPDPGCCVSTQPSKCEYSRIHAGFTSTVLSNEDVLNAIDALYGTRKDNGNLSAPNCMYFASVLCNRLPGCFYMPSDLGTIAGAFQASGSSGSSG